MEQTSVSAAAKEVGAAEKKGGKYLTFELGQEEYGLELLRVREIIALMDITSVPLTPPYVRGVMNLRGKVIPVVDLRCKFGMERTEDHDRKCIIVVDVLKGDQAIQMSILVDAVSEVLHIDEADIEVVASINAGLEADFIQGMAKAKGGVKILLNIDAVLSSVATVDMQSIVNQANDVES
ncbi:MAG: chemotaxis protein CheW [Myxococcales bacterium]|nr:chemotaxis protein CheW [Myxococcales bacterium]MDD9971097.1 chemotaxis protein CheW [Myxococcales bacterium]